MPGKGRRLTGIGLVQLEAPGELLLLVGRQSQVATVSESSGYLRTMSMESPLQNQIDHTNSPEVDSLATLAESSRIVLSDWYDYEFSCNCQVVDLAQKLVGVELPPPALNHFKSVSNNLHKNHKDHEEQRNFLRGLFFFEVVFLIQAVPKSRSPASPRPGRM